MHRPCSVRMVSVWVVVGLPFAVGPTSAGAADVETPAAEARDEPIDFGRARTLLQRERRGENLSPADRDHLRRAKAARRGNAGAGPAPAAQTSIGLTPLTDFSKNDDQGRSGGLYGEGRNTPPDAQLNAALAAAEQVRPLDAAGRPAADGKIALVSIGMSNTTREFQEFVRLAARESAKAPAVVVVDGAQGGKDSADWAQPDGRGAATPWDELDRRLEQAGASAAQVQVVWIKQARKNPATLGGYPGHADALRKDLAVIVRRLKERFPNLRLAYLSSRTYAGYAGGGLNPEPYAYESAFAVRSLIEDQIAGRGGLNVDPATAAAAPVLLWGPYLWADGEQGRKADDLVWKREDFVADGTHPSDSGRRKVAELLLAFFKTDPTAKPWFVRR